MNVFPRFRPQTGVLWLFLGLFALIGGCEREQSAPETAGLTASGLTQEDENALLERVNLRWQAMVRKDFGATYEFTTPVYRSFFSKSMYLKKFSYAVDWELTGVEVVEYDADAAVASVAVRVMSKPTKQTSQASIALGALPATIREKWLKVDGKWWHSAKL